MLTEVLLTKPIARAKLKIKNLQQSVMFQCQFLINVAVEVSHEQNKNTYHTTDHFSVQNLLHHDGKGRWIHPSKKLIGKKWDSQELCTERRLIKDSFHTK